VNSVFGGLNFKYYIYHSKQPSFKKGAVFFSFCIKILEIKVRDDNINSIAVFYQGFEGHTFLQMVVFPVFQFVSKDEEIITKVRVICFENFFLLLSTFYQ